MSARVEWRGEREDFYALLRQVTRVEGEGIKNIEVDTSGDAEVEREERKVTEDQRTPAADVRWEHERWIRFLSTTRRIHFCLFTSTRYCPRRQQRVLKNSGEVKEWKPVYVSKSSLRRTTAIKQTWCTDKQRKKGNQKNDAFPRSRACPGRCADGHCWRDLPPPPPTSQFNSG